jgi:biopolymer transport protein ExbB/TolQ
MNNTALGLVVAITLLLAHMYLETRTTELTDSLEVATVKVMNALYESQQAQQQAGNVPTGGRA